MSYVMGIDPSISATGVCVMHTEKAPKFHTEGSKSTDMDFALRLWHLQCCVVSCIPPNTNPLLAVIETPISPLALKGFGGTGFNNNIMAYGVIYEMLGKFRIPYVEVAPTQLKMVATGRGNASKDEVGEAFDLMCKSSAYPPIAIDHNQIDAYWLAMIGYEVLALDQQKESTLTERTVFHKKYKPHGGWLDLSDKAYDAIEKLEIKGRY